ncbi:IS30 family transposase [Cryptosporangium phraense]|uniref:IS30 family transposase n=1 Tax=Cryptosporangium phraense TaxID=2593070 RepID=A0A545AH86_9ACTN|nr:IS30 family transposase [Cryptosporangium phraense]
MALHGDITLATDLDIYFYDPHSPWQRGSNENTSGLLRQYFPKAPTSPRVSSGDPDWATPNEKLTAVLDSPAANDGLTSGRVKDR